MPYFPKEIAPQTEIDLFNSTSLVVYNGASDNVIWLGPEVNYKFRALHDWWHLKTKLNFTVEEEIELGRIRAAQF